MGKPLPANVSASGAPPSLDRANAVVLGSFAAVGPGLPFEFYGPFNLAIWDSINTTLTTTAGSTAATVASGTGLAAGNAINGVNIPNGTTIGAISGTSVTLALPIVSQPGQVSTLTRQVTGLAQTDDLLGSTVTGIGIPAGTTVVSINVQAVPSNGIVPTVLGTVTLSATPTISTPPSPGRQPTGTHLRFALTGNAVLAGADTAATFTGAAISYSASIQLERSFDGGKIWLVCGIGGSGAQAIWNTGTPVSVIVGEPEQGVAYRLNCTTYSSGTINYRMSESGAAAMSLAVASVI